MTDQTDVGQIGDEVRAMRATELGEAEFVLARAERASAETKERLGLRTARIGGGIVAVAANDPTGGFFNVCVGLGQSERLTAAVLAEVTAFATESHAPLLCLQVAPGADPEEWEELLTEAGAAPSRSWVKFATEHPAVPTAETDLRIERLGPEHGVDFGRVFTLGFGMPLEGGLPEWFAEIPTWEGFTTYGAWDDGELVGAANLFVSEHSAVLAGAATLPARRGLGAQSALMARRIEDANALGARWVTSETGAETPEMPNPSLHNMRRIGLSERYERQNWIWRRG